MFSTLMSDRLKRLERFLDRFTPPPEVMVVVHFSLTVAWAISLPLAIVTGWLWSLAFVSACSIYANFVGHFSAFEASLSTLLTKQQGEDDD